MTDKYSASDYYVKMQEALKTISDEMDLTIDNACDIKRNAQVMREFLGHLTEAILAKKDIDDAAFTMRYFHTANYERHTRRKINLFEKL